MKKYHTVSAVFLLMLAQSGVQGAGDFNPDISLILDGRYVHFDNNSPYELPGFMLSDEAIRTKDGFQLGNSELTLSANIDDLFYGNMTTVISEQNGDTEFELEEAYIETHGLAGGASIKAGRFFSGIGYLNSQHAHNWDFADTPLVYRGLFGGQLRDDGLQIGLLIPSEVTLKFGMEFTRGARFPASNGDNDGARALATFIKLVADGVPNTTWQLGISHWRANVEERIAGSGEARTRSTVPSFRGDSKFSGIDFVLNWSPDGNRESRAITFQAEYYIRDEAGEIGLLDGETVIDRFNYDGQQTGWYAQTVYQIIPGWRTALRYDQLGTDNHASNKTLLIETGLDDDGQHPRRTTLMVDYTHSKHSRLRMQYAHDESYGDNDDVLTFQYIMSLGVHGSHQRQASSE